MSQFMKEAGQEIDRIASAVVDYGHVYAFSRASGLSPWEASSVSARQEKDLPHDVLQHIRSKIDALVEERVRA